MSLTEEERRKVFEEERIRKEMQGKSALVAVILSMLIPGLGDLYCGSWLKAIVFFILNLISFVLMFFAIGFFVYFIVWVCGLISAWMSASKSGTRKMRKVEKSLET